MEKVDISNFTTEELMQLKKGIDDLIEQRTKEAKEKAIVEVESLLARVNTLQATYGIGIDAYLECEDYVGGVSELSVHKSIFSS